MFSALQCVVKLVVILFCWFGWIQTCSFKFCDSVFASYGRYDSLISMSCSRPLDQILLKAMCNSLSLAKSHVTCATCYRRSWVTLETDVTISRHSSHKVLCCGFQHWLGGILFIHTINIVNLLGFPGTTNDQLIQCSTSQQEPVGNVISYQSQPYSSVSGECQLQFDHTEPTTCSRS